MPRRAHSSRARRTSSRNRAAAASPRRRWSSAVISGTGPNRVVLARFGSTITGPAIDGAAVAVVVAARRFGVAAVTMAAIGSGCLSRRRGGRL